MALSPKLLDVLVCPQCKGKLAQVEGGRGLLCHHCQLKFPVRENIPIMLVEEALDMRGGGGAKRSAESSLISPDKSGTQAFRNRVLFQIISGPDAGMKFNVDLGYCRALGRAVSDTTKTAVLNVDWAISLDEETKGLILQYISQQFKKPQVGGPKGDGRGDLGAFKRGPDIVFKDQTLSRLHAMIFFDVVGVGILDLVSKNGTFVNGQEIESCLLKKGDVVELGETKIIFEG